MTVSFPSYFVQLFYSFPPSDSVDMKPAGTSTDCVSVPSASASVCFPTAAAPNAPEAQPSSSSKPGERALVTASDYHLVDPRMGVRRALTISKAVSFVIGLVADAATAAPTSGTRSASSFPAPACGSSSAVS